jgi:hypothetical protein
VAARSKAARSKAARLNPHDVWSCILKNLSATLLAIAVVIELVCLIGAGRHPGLFTASIESTELWLDPWPAPGDQTRVANGQCKIPSGACIAAERSQPSASNGTRNAF